MTGRPILTVEAMRAAEQRAIDGGTKVEELMERAGAALAEAVYRFAGPLPVLVLCGPANNGGDGYVASRHLTERGVKVRVAALSEPKSDAAQWARSQWAGDVEQLSDETKAAPAIIDARPIADVSAIKFLGTELAEKYPFIKTMQVASPSSVDDEKLIIGRGPYVPLASVGPVRVQLGSGRCRAQRGEHAGATVVGGRASQPDDDPARAGTGGGEQELADTTAGAALRLPPLARGEVQAYRLRGLDERGVPDAQDRGGHLLAVRVRDLDAEQVTAERRVEHLDEPRSAVGHRYLLDHVTGCVPGPALRDRG